MLAEASIRAPGRYGYRCFPAKFLGLRGSMCHSAQKKVTTAAVGDPARVGRVETLVGARYSVDKNTRRFEHATYTSVTPPIRSTAAIDFFIKTVPYVARLPLHNPAE